jgi:hypothetical protein
MIAVKTLLALVLVALATTASHAAVLAESTFDAGPEDWSVSGTPVSDPLWHFDVATGDGWILAAGFQPLIAFEAPAKFLGDRSAALGGVLDLELRIGWSDGVEGPLVILSDETTSLQYRAVPPPLFVWTPFAIPLIASGWQTFDGSGGPGVPASDTQLQAVLGNLVRLAINVDWNAPGGVDDGGDDITEIDSVRLSSGPAVAVAEPSTLTFVLGGAVALIAAGRLRRCRHDGPSSGPARGRPVADEGRGEPERAANEPRRHGLPHLPPRAPR